MKSSPYKVAIIGAGNLAWSLIANLQEAGVEVAQIISRNAANLNLYQQRFQIPSASQSINDLDQEVNLVILSVSDQAVGKVAEEVAAYLPSKVVCVHTSGSTNISALASQGEQKGVFYPMQSFTRNKISSLREVPIFLEGNDEVIDFLTPLAEMLSNKVYQLDSEKRQKLHLGAVWVNNFTNLMYKAASQLAGEIDFEVYKPLIEGHLEKVFEFGPEQTQTGPAIRGDISTLQLQLDLLKEYPDLETLYRSLSRGINRDLEI